MIGPVVTRGFAIGSIALVALRGYAALIITPSDCRMFTVEAENRTLNVSSESRTLTVTMESRTLEVPC